MTERDEQGFVKDIKVAINAISNENKSSKEKVKELIELPFSVEDVLDVVNFVNQETNEEVDVRDELYNLAILNEQLVSFDDMFKSKLEERHKELVEALMNRMEGVFKMYDENVNVPMNPEMEQPVDVQTPQLSEFNPEAPVEPMEVVAGEPIATIEAPEMVAPTVDPAAYAEPAVYGEVPAMENPEVASIAEQTMPEVAPVEEYAAPVEEAPQFEPVEVAPAYTEPAMEEAPATEEPQEYNDFIRLLNSLPAEMYQEPVKETTVEESTEYAPVEAYAEPVVEPEVPAVEETKEEAAPVVEEAYVEPEMPTEAAPEEEPVDEEVQQIIDRYDRLKELNIKVYNDQKELKELEAKAEELKTEISNNQEEIRTLAA